MSTTMVKAIHGRVSSGRSLANQHLKAHTEQLTAILNATPYPGTLNITLNTPIKLSTASATHLGEHGHRMVWRARLGCRKVVLYRWQGCPLSVVEIVSDVHLRSELGLKDQAPVTITISSADLDIITFREWTGWLLVWKWRSRLYYSCGAYNNWTVSLQRYFDGKINMATLTKMVSGRVRNLFSRPLRRIHVGSSARPPFARIAPREGEKGEIDRLVNLISYTKASNSAYSASKYPAGYHTLTLEGITVPGQRMPSARLDPLPMSLEGLTILDIGCNQGGMLFEAARRGMRWGVGVDYDPRMINAGNKIRQHKKSSNIDFFVFDIEKEELPRLQDFMPGDGVDIVFLLSVCMWISNWREVIEFCASLAPHVLFESNGSPEQQSAQFECLSANFGAVKMLRNSSDEDNEQKSRRLYLCTR